MNFSLRVCALALYALTESFVPSLSAAPPSLDTRYDGRGYTSPISGSSPRMLMGPDDSVYMALSRTNDICLTKYLTDGWVDARFAAGGIAKIASNGYDTEYYFRGISFAPNGRPTVFLDYYKEYEEKDRYGNNLFSKGSFLREVTTAGVVQPTSASFTTTRGENCLTVQPSGKTVIAARVDSEKLVLQRYSGRTLDETFGTYGSQAVSFGTLTAVYDLKQQADGKLVLAGSGGEYVGPNQPRSNVTIARFNANGNVDTSFGKAGKAILDLGGSSSATAMAIQTDGKLVVAGPHSGAFRRTFVARFLPSGQIDRGFAGKGYIEIETPLRLASGIIRPEINTVVVQKDGRIVIGGSIDYTFNNATGFRGTGEAFLLRLNANGTPDTSFGSNGRKENIFGSQSGYSSIHDMAIQKDGRLVAAAWTSPQWYDGQVMLARFNMLIRPDMMGGPKTGSKTGLGIINKTGSGQTLIHKLKRKGGKSTSFLRIQNSGHEPEVFHVKGSKGDKNFAVAYFNGKTDVTAAVTGGKFRTKSLAPGTTQLLEVKVKAKTKHKGKSRSIFVTTNSPADSLATDTILLKLSSK